MMTAVKSSIRRFGGATLLIVALLSLIALVVASVGCSTAEMEQAVAEANTQIETLEVELEAIESSPTSDPLSQATARRIRQELESTRALRDRLEEALANSPTWEDFLLAALGGAAATGVPGASLLALFFKQRKLWQSSFASLVGNIKTSRLAEDSPSVIRLDNERLKTLNTATGIQPLIEPLIKPTPRSTK